MINAFRNEFSEELHFEMITLDTLRSEKSYVKIQRKQQKDLESLKKKQQKERMSVQKQQCGAIEKMIKNKKWEWIKKKKLLIN